MVSLSQSLLVPVLPMLPEQLHTSAANVEWLLTSTLLVGAVAVPTFGRLGDMFGKRRLLLVAVGALTLGSLLDAVTDNLGAADRRPRDPGRVARRHPARHQPAQLVAAARAGAVGDRADQRDARRRRLARPAAGRCGRRARRLPRAVLDHRDRGRGLARGDRARRPRGRRTAPVGGWTWSAPRSCSRSRWSRCCCRWRRATSGAGRRCARSALLVIAVVLLVVFVAYERRVRDPLVDIRATTRRPIVLTNLASILFGFALFASLIGTASYVEAPAASGYGFGVVDRRRRPVPAAERSGDAAAVAARGAVDPRVGSAPHAGRRRRCCSPLGWVQPHRADRRTVADRASGRRSSAPRPESATRRCPR